jgi:hypothetical protein
MSKPLDPREALDQLGAIWSDDFDAYASGELDASKIHCALCMCAPCRCPKFGSDAYFALLDFRHGRPKRDTSPPCDDPACPVTAQCGPHPRGIAMAGTGMASVACITEPEVIR